MQKNTIFSGIKPLTVFVLTLTLFILIISCSSKAPVVSSIDPKIGRMGEIITLTGSNFGEERGESYVSIAGVSLTSSSYYVWGDNLVVVRVPEFGESGLVYVHVRGKKSNGVLFSNSASVPRPIEGEEMGLEPKIASVVPQVGAPGSLVIITGNNFGASRENAGVFFSWDYDATFSPYVVREPEFIEVSEIEAGYEYWSAREIRIRLPDGAVSGNIEVRTPYGISRPVFFDVSGKPGHKNFKDKRSYTITYSVDIRVLDATRPNNLYLWIPKPVTSPSQRNVTLVSRSIEPFIEDHQGVSLFKLDNLISSVNQSINLSYNVEVYAVEARINPLSVNQSSTGISVMHTQSTALIPSNDQRIKTAVSSIIGREQNPYRKARLIYDWIITNMQITNTPPLATNLVTAMERKRADPYTVALLYTTMARAAGVPCVPSAGVLIDRSGQTLRHYWSEFWIDGFGWIPVDPAMGAGAVDIEMNPRDDNMDNTNYYFGSTDNQRIIFSRGEIALKQMENRGRLVSRPQAYSLQNIWEEAVGGLESYSSLWGDIIISGIYVQ
ncbi:MAG: IPT/TIG domain-containing protein [Treponema sp.]|nr:IPT/TIG domain-containing protein [Treponema sp.]